MSVVVVLVSLSETPAVMLLQGRVAGVCFARVLAVILARKIMEQASVGVNKSVPSVLTVIAILQKTNATVHKIAVRLLVQALHRWLAGIPYMISVAPSAALSEQALTQANALILQPFLAEHLSMTAAATAAGQPGLSAPAGPAAAVCAAVEILVQKQS